MKSAKEYRDAALASLKGKWGGAVIMTLVVFAISGAASGCNQLVKNASILISIVLLPMTYGYMTAFLDNIREDKDYKVGQIFTGFNDYTRIFGTEFLKTIYIVLWALLFFVPGIIKSYSYAMTEYILRDHPELKFNGAIERSMAMMKGHKFDLFYLHLTFIGWGLLCIVTFGIGLLWLYPYMYAAQAHFYEDRKAEFEGQTTAQPAEA